MSLNEEEVLACRCTIFLVSLFIRINSVEMLCDTIKERMLLSNQIAHESVLNGLCVSLSRLASGDLLQCFFLTMYDMPLRRFVIKLRGILCIITK